MSLPSHSEPGPPPVFEAETRATIDIIISNIIVIFEGKNNSREISQILEILRVMFGSVVFFVLLFVTNAVRSPLRLDYIRGWNSWNSFTQWVDEKALLAQGIGIP